MKITEIETPALILEEDIFRKNMQCMQEIIWKSGLKLRPHYKSHRCPEIAKLQLKYGAAGMCCAKVGEAEDLAACGIEDILVANEVTVPAKVKRLARLAHKSKITVCVDDIENIRMLAKEAANENVILHIYVEYDIGQKRCGVMEDQEVLQLAQEIKKYPTLVFDGIQAYAGHLAHEYTEEKRRKESEVIEEKLRNLKKMLEENGISVQEISGISTGTLLFRTEWNTVYTEAQPGSYLFSDNAYKKVGIPFQNSLFILASVISKKKDRIVTDAGLKTCSTDMGNPVLVNEICDSDMSEEHITHNLPDHNYQVNDQVYYIPGHCCTNVNLFDQIYLVKDDEVIRTMMITSRGKSN